MGYKICHKYGLGIWYRLIILWFYLVSISGSSVYIYLPKKFVKNDTKDTSVYTFQNALKRASPKHKSHTSHHHHKKEHLHEKRLELVLTKYLPKKHANRHVIVKSHSSHRLPSHHIEGVKGIKKSTHGSNTLTDFPLKDVVSGLIQEKPSVSYHPSNNEYVTKDEFKDIPFLHFEGKNNNPINFLTQNDQIGGNTFYSGKSIRGRHYKSNFADQENRLIDNSQLAYWKRNPFADWTRYTGVHSIPMNRFSFSKGTEWKNPDGSWVYYGQPRHLFENQNLKNVVEGQHLFSGNYPARTNVRYWNDPNFNIGYENDFYSTDTGHDSSTYKVHNIETNPEYVYHNVPNENSRINLQRYDVNKEHTDKAVIRHHHKRPVNDEVIIDPSLLDRPQEIKSNDNHDNYISKGYGNRVQNTPHHSHYVNNNIDLYADLDNLQLKDSKGNVIDHLIRRPDPTKSAQFERQPNALDVEDHADHVFDATLVNVATPIQKHVQLRNVSSLEPATVLQDYKLGHSMNTIKKLLEVPQVMKDDISSHEVPLHVVQGNNLQGTDNIQLKPIVNGDRFTDEIFVKYRTGINDKKAQTFGTNKLHDYDTKNSDRVKSIVGNLLEPSSSMSELSPNYQSYQAKKFGVSRDIYNKSFSEETVDSGVDHENHLSTFSTPEYMKKSDGYNNDLGDSYSNYIHNNNRRVKQERLVSYPIKQYHRANSSYDENPSGITIYHDETGDNLIDETLIHQDNHDKIDTEKKYSNNDENIHSHIHDRMGNADRYRTLHQKQLHTYSNKPYNNDITEHRNIEAVNDFHARPNPISSNSHFSHNFGNEGILFHKHKKHHHYKNAAGIGFGDKFIDNFAVKNDNMQYIPMDVPFSRKGNGMSMIYNEIPPHINKFDGKDYEKSEYHPRHDKDNFNLHHHHDVPHYVSKNIRHEKKKANGDDLVPLGQPGENVKNLDHSNKKLVSSEPSAIHSAILKDINDLIQKLVSNEQIKNGRHSKCIFTAREDKASNIKTAKSKLNPECVEKHVIGMNQKNKSKEELMDMSAYRMNANSSAMRLFENRTEDQKNTERWFTLFEGIVPGNKTHPSSLAQNTTPNSFNKNYTVSIAASPEIHKAENAVFDKEETLYGKQIKKQSKTKTHHKSNAKMSKNVKTSKSNQRSAEKHHIDTMNKQRGTKDSEMDVLFKTLIQHMGKKDKTKYADMLLKGIEGHEKHEYIDSMLDRDVNSQQKLIKFFTIPKRVSNFSMDDTPNHVFIQRSEDNIERSESELERRINTPQHVDKTDEQRNSPKSPHRFSRSPSVAKKRKHSGVLSNPNPDSNTGDIDDVITISDESNLYAKAYIQRKREDNFLRKIIEQMELKGDLEGLLRLYSSTYDSSKMIPFTEEAMRIIEGESIDGRENSKERADTTARSEPRSIELIPSTGDDKYLDVDDLDLSLNLSNASDTSDARNEVNNTSYNETSNYDAKSATKNVLRFTHVSVVNEDSDKRTDDDDESLKKFEKISASNVTSNRSSSNSERSLGVQSNDVYVNSIKPTAEKNYTDGNVAKTEISKHNLYAHTDKKMSLGKESDRTNKEHKSKNAKISSKGKDRFDSSSRRNIARNQLENADDDDDDDMNNDYGYDYESTTDDIYPKIDEEGGYTDNSKETVANTFSRETSDKAKDLTLHDDFDESATKNNVVGRHISDARSILKKIKTQKNSFVKLNKLEELKRYLELIIDDKHHGITRKENIQMPNPKDQIPFIDSGIESGKTGKRDSVEPSLNKSNETKEEKKKGEKEYNTSSVVNENPDKKDNLNLKMKEDDDFDQFLHEYELKNPDDARPRTFTDDPINAVHVDSSKSDFDREENDSNLPNDIPNAMHIDAPRHSSLFDSGNNLHSELDDVGIESKSKQNPLPNSAPLVGPMMDPGRTPNAHSNNFISNKINKPMKYKPDVDYDDPDLSAIMAPDVNNVNFKNNPSVNHLYDRRPEFSDILGKDVYPMQRIVPFQLQSDPRFGVGKSRYKKLRYDDSLARSIYPYGSDADVLAHFKTPYGLQSSSYNELPSALHIQMPFEKMFSSKPRAPFGHAQYMNSLPFKGPVARPRYYNPVMKNSNALFPHAKQLLYLNQTKVPLLRKDLSTYRRVSQGIQSTSSRNHLQKEKRLRSKSNHILKEKPNSNKIYEIKGREVYDNAGHLLKIASVIKEKPAIKEEATNFVHDELEGELPNITDTTAKTYSKHEIRPFVSHKLVRIVPKPVKHRVTHQQITSRINKKPHRTTDTIPDLYLDRNYENKEKHIVSGNINPSGQDDEKEYKESTMPKYVHARAKPAHDIYKHPVDERVRHNRKIIVNRAPSYIRTHSKLKGEKDTQKVSPIVLSLLAPTRKEDSGNIGNLLDEVHALHSHLRSAAKTLDSITSVNPADQRRKIINLSSHKDDDSDLMNTYDDIPGKMLGTPSHPIERSRLHRYRSSLSHHATLNPQNKSSIEDDHQILRKNLANVVSFVSNEQISPKTHFSEDDIASEKSLVDVNENAFMFNSAQGRDEPIQQRESTIFHQKRPTNYLVYGNSDTQVNFQKHLPTLMRPISSNPNLVTFRIPHKQLNKFTNENSKGLLPDEAFRSYREDPELYEKERLLQFHQNLNLPMFRKQNDYFNYPDEHGHPLYNAPRKDFSGSYDSFPLSQNAIDRKIDFMKRVQNLPHDVNPHYYPSKAFYQHAMIRDKHIRPDGFEPRSNAHIADHKIINDNAPRSSKAEESNKDTNATKANHIASIEDQPVVLAPLTDLENTLNIDSSAITNIFKQFNSAEKTPTSVVEDKNRNKMLISRSLTGNSSNTESPKDINRMVLTSIPLIDIFKNTSQTKHESPPVNSLQRKSDFVSDEELASNDQDVSRPVPGRAFSNATIDPFEFLERNTSLDYQPELSKRSLLQKLQNISTEKKDDDITANVKAIVMRMIHLRDIPDDSSPSKSDMFEMHSPLDHSIQHARDTLHSYRLDKEIPRGTGRRFRERNLPQVQRFVNTESRRRDGGELPSVNKKVPTPEDDTKPGGVSVVVNIASKPGVNMSTNIKIPAEHLNSPVPPPPPPKHDKPPNRNENMAKDDNKYPDSNDDDQPLLKENEEIRDKQKDLDDQKMKDKLKDLLTKDKDELEKIEAKENDKAGMGNDVEGKGDKAGMGNDVEGKGDKAGMGNDVEGKGVEGKGVEGKGVEGKGVEGKGIEGKGIEGKGIEGKGIEGKGIEGKGIEGKGIEGKGIEGKGIEGKGIEGKGIGNGMEAGMGNSIEGKEDGTGMGNKIEGKKDSDGAGNGIEGKGIEGKMDEAKNENDIEGKGIEGKEDGSQMGNNIEGKGIEGKEDDANIEAKGIEGKEDSTQMGSSVEGKGIEAKEDKTEMGNKIEAKNEEKVTNKVSIKEKEKVVIKDKKEEKTESKETTSSESKQNQPNDIDPGYSQETRENNSLGIKIPVKLHTKQEFENIELGKTKADKNEGINESMELPLKNTRLTTHHAGNHLRIPSNPNPDDNTGDIDDIEAVSNKVRVSGGYHSATAAHGLKKVPIMDVLNSDHDTHDNEMATNTRNDTNGFNKSGRAMHGKYQEPNDTTENGSESLSKDSNLDSDATADVLVNSVNDVIHNTNVYDYESNASPNNQNRDGESNTMKSSGTDTEDIISLSETPSPISEASAPTGHYTPSQKHAPLNAQPNTNISTIQEDIPQTEDSNSNFDEADPQEDMENDSNIKTNLAQPLGADEGGTLVPQYKVAAVHKTDGSIYRNDQNLSMEAYFPSSLSESFTDSSEYMVDKGIDERKRAEHKQVHQLIRPAFTIKSNNVDNFVTNHLLNVTKNDTLSDKTSETSIDDSLNFSQEIGKKNDTLVTQEFQQLKPTNSTITGNTSAFSSYRNVTQATRDVADEIIDAISYLYPAKKHSKNASSRDETNSSSSLIKQTFLPKEMPLSLKNASDLKKLSEQVSNNSSVANSLELLTMIRDEYIHEIEKVYHEQRDRLLHDKNASKGSGLKLAFDADVSSKRSNKTELHEIKENSTGDDSAIPTNSSNHSVNLKPHLLSAHLGEHDVQEPFKQPFDVKNHSETLNHSALLKEHHQSHSKQTDGLNILFENLKKQRSMLESGNKNSTADATHRNQTSSRNTLSNLSEPNHKDTFMNKTPKEKTDNKEHKNALENNYENLKKTNNDENKSKFSEEKENGQHELVKDISSKTKDAEEREKVGEKNETSSETSYSLKDPKPVKVRVKLTMKPPSKAKAYEEKLSAEDSVSNNKNNSSTDLGKQDQSINTSINVETREPKNTTHDTNSSISVNDESDPGLVIIADGFENQDNSSIANNTANINSIASKNTTDLSTLNATDRMSAHVKKRKDKNLTSAMPKTNSSNLNNATEAHGMKIHSKHREMAKKNKTMRTDKRKEGESSETHLDGKTNTVEFVPTNADNDVKKLLKDPNISDENSTEVIPSLTKSNMTSESNESAVDKRIALAPPKIIPSPPNALTPVMLKDGFGSVDGKVKVQKNSILIIASEPEKDIPSNVLIKAPFREVLNPSMEALFDIPGRVAQLKAEITNVSSNDNGISKEKISTNLQENLGFLMERLQHLAKKNRLAKIRTLNNTSSDSPLSEIGNLLKGTIQIHDLDADPSKKHKIEKTTRRKQSFPSHYNDNIQYNDFTKEVETNFGNHYKGSAEVNDLMTDFPEPMDDAKTSRNKNKTKDNVISKFKNIFSEIRPFSGKVASASKYLSKHDPKQNVMKQFDTKDVNLRHLIEKLIAKFPGDQKSPRSKKHSSSQNDLKNFIKENDIEINSEEYKLIDNIYNFLKGLREDDRLAVLTELKSINNEYERTSKRANTKSKLAYIKDNSVTTPAPKNYLILPSRKHSQKRKSVVRASKRMLRRPDVPKYHVRAANNKFSPTRIPTDDR